MVTHAIIKDIYCHKDVYRQKRKIFLCIRFFGNSELLEIAHLRFHTFGYLVFLRSDCEGRFDEMYFNLGNVVSYKNACVSRLVCLAAALEDEVRHSR